MHKKQQDRKRRKNPFEPQAEERYFRHNEGGTDYVSIPSITFSSNFWISFSFISYGSSFNMFMGRQGFGAPYIGLTGSNNLELSTGGGFISLGTAARNVINTVIISRIGGNIKGSINGIESPETADDTVINFDILCAYNNGLLPLDGILSNVSMGISGTEERNYPINDNGNTIRDLVSGQDGTVINPAAGDWGLFKDQSTLWKGQNLAVPPWDSVDQELIKA